MIPNLRIFIPEIVFRQLKTHQVNKNKIMENKKKEESIKRILKAARKNQEFRQALIEEMEKVQRENLKT